MRRIFAVFTLFASLSLSAIAQERTHSNDLETRGIVDSSTALERSRGDWRDAMGQMDGYMEGSQYRQLREPRFRLYPTDNDWLFFKFDTATGRLWMVQISYGMSPRGTAVIDDTVKTNPGESLVNGRFTLTPSEDTRLFVIMDTEDGRCWQVKVIPSALNMTPRDVIVEPLDSE